MAIRELSHERRNIMLPMYWRCLYYLNDTTARPLNSTAYLIVPGTAVIPITVYEDSILRFQYSAFVDRTNADGWVTTQFQVQDTSTPVSVNMGAAIVYHQALVAASAARQSASILGFVTQNAAAGLINYEIQYAESTANSTQVLRQAISVDICKA